jgi:hypothetical protein
LDAQLRRMQEADSDDRSHFRHADGGTLFAGSAVIRRDQPPAPFAAADGLRLTGMCRHPGGEKNFCLLTEDGQLLGASADGGKAEPIFADLPKALGLGGGPVQMRALLAIHDRLYVAADLAPESVRTTGRLAEWNWRGTWRVIDSSPFVDLAGVEHPDGIRESLVFALGYDDLSALLRFWNGTAWKRYRLPWGTAAHAGPAHRLRQIAPDRWLLNAFDLLFELQPPQDANEAPQLRPLCRLARNVEDFCAWNGGIALAGGQFDSVTRRTSPTLLTTSLEDLARGQRPGGGGAVWKRQAVAPGTVSDPFFMGGFERKTVHLANDGDKPAVVDIEVDPDGSDDFRALYRVELAPGGYLPYVFPEGYSAQWWRLRVAEGATLTATVSYE